MDFIYQLDGVSQTDEKIAVHFRNAQGDLDFTSAALKVDGRIDISEPIFGKDFRFLQSVVSTAVPKLTIPSPSMVHYRGGAAAIDKSVYPDEAQFWDDLSAAYAKQVAGIAALGGTYLQLDDTSLAYLNDPRSAPCSPRRAATPSTSTSATSARSTRRSATVRSRCT